MAVAGMTCTDWSSRGPRLGFLGDSFLAWIFWVREMLILMPVLIIGECTIHFNHQAFAGIMRGYYELGAVIFSPSDVGLPCERQRKYMILRRIGSCSPLVPFSLKGFGATMYRQVKANGDMYYQAPASLVNEFIVRLAAKMHLPPVNRGGQPWAWIQVASRGLEKRLSASLRRISDKVGGHALLEALHIDIAQTENFTGASPYIPALLPNSVMYSTVLRRPMLCQEHLEVMGMGIFMDESQQAEQDPGKCPFMPLVTDASDLAFLSPTRIAKLVGNSMVAVAVGSVIVFALSFSDFSEVTHQADNAKGSPNMDHASGYAKSLL